MNPLLWKIGIPLTVLAVLAFMRYTNKKTMGEPFFPGADDLANKLKAGGGAGSPPTEGVMNSPNEVLDSGTYSDYSEPSYTDTSTDSSSSGDTSIAVTGAGAGSGVAGSSIPGLRGGIGIGGVAQPSQPVATAISNTFTNSPYTGGYQPYSPTPATVPVSNQFGGQGGGGVFAM